MLRWILQGGVCVALLACVVGCSGGGGGGNHPDTVAVTGTVTYNGSAVDGATVVFSPAGGSQESAFGTTDSSGAFSLKTHWGADGAVPGKYKITVMKTEGEVAGSGDGEEVEMVIEEEGSAKPSAISHSLPTKYNSAASTDLEEEVTAGGDNNFDLTLTD